VQVQKEEEQEEEEEEEDELFHVIHAGVGELFLTDPNLVHKLDRANLRCNILSNNEMETLLWYKLAANCFCNPLTAIHQCTNGALYRLDNFETLLHRVVQEVGQIHRVATKTNEYDFQRAEAFVRKVIDDNINNQSSMQQDVFHQRPTEINYLNGYIARLSEQYNISCPVNMELWKTIQVLEASYVIKPPAQKIN
jgi:2-dehydropantoate 2-reductase